MAKDSKTQLTINGSPVAVVVDHGSTAGTARPDGVSVFIWKGSVTPTNSVDGDVWVDSA